MRTIISKPCDIRTIISTPCDMRTIISTPCDMRTIISAPCDIRTIISALVLGKLFYCSTLWSNTTATNIKKLQAFRISRAESSQKPRNLST